MAKRKSKGKEKPRIRSLSQEFAAFVEPIMEDLLDAPAEEASDMLHLPLAVWNAVIFADFFGRPKQMEILRERPPGDRAKEHAKFTKIIEWFVDRKRELFADATRLVKDVRFEVVGDRTLRIHVDELLLATEAATLGDVSASPEEKGSGRGSGRTKPSKSRTKKACGLCGSTTKRLTKTECCGQWICDDEHEYQLFSFERNSCLRNHRRYTLCGGHFHSEHEGRWQECAKCRDEIETEMYVWYGTNEYNFEKLDNPPAYEPTLCDGCGKVIRLAYDGHSWSGGKTLCMKCSEMPPKKQRKTKRRSDR